MPQLSSSFFLSLCILYTFSFSPRSTGTFCAPQSPHTSVSAGANCFFSCARAYRCVWHFVIWLFTRREDKTEESERGEKRWEKKRKEKEIKHKSASTSCLLPREIHYEDIVSLCHSLHWKRCLSLTIFNSTAISHSNVCNQDMNCASDWVNAFVAFSLYFSLISRGSIFYNFHSLINLVLRSYTRVTN